MIACRTARSSMLSPRREVSHEATREAVAGSRRIHDVLQGEGDGREPFVLPETEDAVLAPLHDESRRPHGAYPGSGLHEIVLRSELPRLLVIDDQDVHLRQHLPKLRGSPLDPVVHGVGPDEPGRAHLLHHVHLERRVNVREEDQRRSPEVLGDGRLKALENTEIGEKRGPLRQIGAVLPSPAKRLSPGRLEAREIHGSPVEDLTVLLGEIVPNHRHHVDRGEEGRR